jgi:hypothetical protein
MLTRPGLQNARQLGLSSRDREDTGSMPMLIQLVPLALRDRHLKV